MSEEIFKDANLLCKTIMRNGYDAYIINAPLQTTLIHSLRLEEIDLCTDAPKEELLKMFSYPSIPTEEENLILQITNGGVVFRFYSMPCANTSIDNLLRKTSPHIEKNYLVYTEKLKNKKYKETKYNEENITAPHFKEIKENISFEEPIAKTLRKNYLLAIQAMRYSANYSLPIEKNSWIAIVASATEIADVLSAKQIIDEWRLVSAEHMWKFAKLLYESTILHFFIPELTALASIKQNKATDSEEESVLEHTFSCMKLYPEGNYKEDWLGTFALLFHDLGKLHAGEYFQGKWMFYHHHQIGAKIARKVLRRLHMPSEEIDLICELVKNHMRFQFMMTDRGIRKFKSIPSYERLIAITKANILAHEDSYTAFNHNKKYLERAETPEELLEPLLNGNEIMEVTGLSPGPHIGILRKALLKAQITRQVKNLEEAKLFINHLASDI